MRWLITCGAWSVATLATAQVEAVRLGVHSSCPDGLPGCWAIPHEGLTRLKGVSVSEVPDFRTWMVPAKVSGGGLPDVQLIDQAVRATGQFFSVRGCEVTLKGTIFVEQGAELLAVPGLPKPVLLVRAEKSHEWDPKRASERPLRQDEANAIARLKAVKVKKPLVVIGWLRPEADSAKRPVLEVVAVKIPTSDPNKKRK